MRYLYGAQCAYEYIQQTRKKWIRKTKESKKLGTEVKELCLKKSSALVK